MRRTPALTFGVVIGFALPMLGSVAPASARLVERGEFHDVFTGVFDDYCDQPGFTVEIEAVADGRFADKSRGSDGLLFGADHTAFTQTTTNPVNGLSVVDITHALTKDLHVTDNGDGTLTILVLQTGPSTTYGPDGTPIARNPGQVRFEVVVDHGGTPTDPSDDTELSLTQVRDSTGRTDDYCAAIIDAIG